jgi:ADP-ribose pyrophosphatase YjhB (NUDIX family)
MSRVIKLGRDGVGRADDSRQEMSRLPVQRMSNMNFCSNCGARVAPRIPPGDNLPRHVCGCCRTIHYRNPLLVVGCVPEHEKRILLCRRAIEPRRGYWTVPAGFMENGETLQQAAARESREEALAEVVVGSLLAIVHVLPADQVHVFFRAAMPEARFGVGLESLEVALFDPSEIPWAEMAFPNTNYVLRRYLEDQTAGREGHYFTTYERRTPLRSSDVTGWPKCPDLLSPPSHNRR